MGICCATDVRRMLCLGFVVGWELASPVFVSVPAAHIAMSAVDDRVAVAYRSSGASVTRLCGGALRYCAPWAPLGICHRMGLECDAGSSSWGEFGLLVRHRPQAVGSYLVCLSLLVGPLASACHIHQIWSGCVCMCAQWPLPARINRHWQSLMVFARRCCWRCQDSRALCVGDLWVYLAL